MKTYEPEDELVSLYVRLRHETLPIHPPAASVELPDGSHELVAPPDPFAWLDAIGAPMTPVRPVPRSEPSLVALAAMVLIVLVGLVNAGYWLGVWVR